MCGRAEYVEDHNKAHCCPRINVSFPSCPCNQRRQTSFSLRTPEHVTISAACQGRTMLGRKFEVPLRAWSYCPSQVMGVFCSASPMLQSCISHPCNFHSPAACPTLQIYWNIRHKDSVTIFIARALWVCTYDVRCCSAAWHKLQHRI